MIRAVSWFCADHCGGLVPGGRSWRQQSPAVTATEEMLPLIGRPVKYFPRMTTESRSCLAAASLALRACGWKDTASREIGLVGAGYEGCVRADQEYFRDYVASGRSLGRGNLFIYTLPTSTLGEVAIALTLTGPTLHIHDPARPVAVLVAQAEQLVEEGESDAMLAVWSDCAAAVCFAIDRGQPENSLVGFVWEQGPLEMAQSLASMVQRI